MVSRGVNMRLTRIVFLLGLSLSLGTSTTLPQWVPSSNGLNNLQVHTMAVSHGVILAGTEKGIYRSTDRGDSWSALGPDTSAIHDIAVEEERIFVLAGTGLYLSTHAGEIWREVKTSGWPTATRAASVGMRGSSLWVGTAYTGVMGRDPLIYTTTDTGATWSAQTTPPSFGTGGDTREMSPLVVNGPDLFASLRYKGVLYRSRDDGKNWTPTTPVPLLDPSYHNNFPDVAVEDSTIVVLVNSHLAMSVFRSTNLGLDWVETNTDLPQGYSTGAAWSHCALHGSDIYITSDSAEFGTVPPTVYRSTDNGSSWINLGSIPGSGNFSGVVMDTHAVYVGTQENGVYKHPFNMEGSLHFTLYQEEPFGLLGPYGRVRLTKNKALVGDRRADANSTVLFDRLPTGFYGYRVYNDRPTPWGEQYWGGNTVQVAPGAITPVNHTHNTPYMPGARVYIDSTNELLSFGTPREIGAGTRLRVEVDIYRPPDGNGDNVFIWSQIILDRDMIPPYDLEHTGSWWPFRPGETRHTPHYPVLLEPGSYSLSCAATTQFIGLTDAGGWLDPAFTIVRAPPVPVLASPPDRGTQQPVSLTLCWLATDSATSYHVQVATDSTFASGIVLNDSVTADTNHATGQLSYGTTYYWRVRARTSAGMSPFSPAWRFTTLLPLPSRVELTGPASGVNTGTVPVVFTWRTATPEVTGYWFAIATDSGFVFAVHDSTLTDTVHVRQTLANGTYWWRVRARNMSGWGPFSDVRRLTVSITGVSGESPLPAGFVLYESYPSPFNAMTTIRYGLPHAAHVLLTVWSVLGQHIATLHDAEQEAGYHELRFDARDLPSGFYLYRLNAGTYTAVRKLLLLR